MEVLDFIKEVIAPTPRKGFMLSLTFGATVAFAYWQIWPFSLMTDPFIVGSAIAALSGAAMLIVTCAEACAGKVKMWRSDRREAADARKQAEDDCQTALENVDILDEYDLEALLWLLSRDSPRFQASPSNSHISCLYFKKIVQKPENSIARDVWLVRDAVWERRQEILRKYKHVHLPESLPHSSWMA